MASQVRMDLKGAGQPVTCLGQIFANDDERREHFRDSYGRGLPIPLSAPPPAFRKAATTTS